MLKNRVNAIYCPEQIDRVVFSVMRAPSLLAVEVQKKLQSYIIDSKQRHILKIIRGTDGRRADQGVGMGMLKIE